MKNLNNLLILVGCLVGFSINAQVNFNFTGAQQSYIVPAGVTLISIDAYGAQGGTAEGGQGGYAFGELSVTPGQTVYINVGGQGNTINVSSGSSVGGWNGGGAGGSGTSGASGGGASDVRLGGTALTDRVIVAGGGGGMDYDGSNNTLGGDGGGLIGNSGIVAGSTGTASTGGTQSAGGIGGTSQNNTGNPGVLGVGGATVFYTNSTYQYGGGGGGGYYGGAAGHPWASGAGGSSYIGGVINGITTTGGRTGDGLIVITGLCSATTIVPDLPMLTDVSGECSAAQPSAPTATNNCGLTVSGIPDITFPVTSQGTTTITWTYNDSIGNTLTQTQNVVIADNTSPIADLANLSDISDECEATPTAPTATDNCSGAITGIPDVSFPITASGTTTVTWTYDDGNGNTSTQSQDIIITPIDNGITQVDPITLSADATGYNYQWIDCDNGNTPIAGATNQTFTPTVASNYACEIDNGICTVTTACLTSSVGVDENDFGSGLVVYPNPTFGDLTIDLGNTYSNILVFVYNSLGQEVLNKQIPSSSSVELSILDAAGIYTIEIRTEERKSAIIHVVKK